VAKTFLRGRADEAPFLLQPRDRIIAMLIGAACGFVVGLTSVGSGTFFGLAMPLVYPLTAQKIVGTESSTRSASRSPSSSSSAESSSWECRRHR